MASATGLTIDDFERLPQALADNHELVDGELIKMSGNTPQHNLFRDFLTSLLRSYVREHQLGRIISEQEFDFGGNAHGPDISFISQAQCSLINMKVRVQRFVPDLAIEIVSANDTFEKLGIAKNAREEKLKARDTKIKQDAENAKMARLYREHVLGEKPKDGFIPLDTLIAPAPKPTPEASKEPVMGD